MLFRSAETGATLNARFGAVGAMKELLDGGAPCDVIILTAKMIGDLGLAGTALGRVRTGVAVKAGHAKPDVGTPDGLRAALLAADGVYFPDPERATAGIHFASVMQQLGVHEALRPRWRTFPNGATAMRELAAAASARPIGCTQVTEIRYTPGVELAGLLPRDFELATVYTAAPAQGAADPALAARFVALLAGTDTQALRAQGGFED